MAVFTEVSNTQLDELLSHYDIGQARSLKGIASGIENSNFYLDTDKGKYVLTIFERLNKDQLPYYLELTSHLGKKCLAVSYPIPRKDGGLLSEINGKPCSIAPTGHPLEIAPLLWGYLPVIKHPLEGVHTALGV